MKNLRHQIKSQWYYVFWGSMAVAVIGGQIYVGLGYREMAKASKSTEVFVTCVTPYETPTFTPNNKTYNFE